ncbi:LytR/AlgR family response regulator transcription factor [Glacieibacterium frigidum]|uniref:Response regulator transcription factor n=1 Tax=Glacieibacterium frigidum TaxID=2593303 RepID=A0A552UFM5_9SPHN|nr:LytTR family DNA-binding domain-containing protein [Glacieibacterium frigidum]TRW17026.1 response regulator transcription factor [Glacieibacterium frigidum]
MPDAPLRTLIVDDEPLGIERLQILCASLPEIRLVGSAGDASAALRLIDATAPELLLLDITMPGMSGIALATELSQRPVRPLIIFCTAYDNFAVAAFEVEAVDYLLKPIDAARLARAVARAQAKRDAPAAAAESNWASEFWVPHRGEILRIDVAAIDRIEAERDYMRLHLGERSYLMHATIAALEQRLDPQAFIRLHRSTIVRRDRIAGLRREGGGTWSAVLTDGRVASIGRTYLDAARALTQG